MLRPGDARGHRRGSVLVEFALIALVLYLLLAATIEFGRMIFTAQAAQTAADVGARELAKTPLPPALTFEEALYKDFGSRPGADRAAITTARSRVFSQDYLVLDLADPQNADLNAVFANAPAINQQLRVLMVVDDQRPDGGPWLLRYPGALVPVPSDETPTPTGLTVRIPLTTVDAGGNETIAPENQWLRPVEEVRAAGVSEGPFSLVAPDPNPLELRGTVALRINYPYQAAALTGFARPTNEFPPPPNIGTPVVPDPADDGTRPGPNAGPYGLGRQYALGKEVRPYRKVISTQAFARREVFN